MDMKDALGGTKVMGTDYSRDIKIKRTTGNRTEDRQRSSEPGRAVL